MRCARAAMGVLIVLAAATPAEAKGQKLSQQDKATINALLNRIEHQKDLKFVRLDKTYSASTAAKYMRFKWHQNDSKVHNVQDFINLESVGGSHGEVTYYVQYPDGHRRPARDVMEETVQQLRASGV